jgi:hypothetical protein
MTAAVTKPTANVDRVIVAGEKALASPYYLWDFFGVGPTF